MQKYRIIQREFGTPRAQSERAILKRDTEKEIEDLREEILDSLVADAQELDMYRPLPPDILVNALQDTVHKTYRKEK